MQFPSSKLVSDGGKIYAHIFENPNTGLKRGIFWSVTVHFKPIKYADESFRCSTTCEWIPWKAANWLDLHGRHFDVEYGECGIESSFYSGEHDICTRTRLRLAHKDTCRFHVSVDVIVDFQGCCGGDENPAMPVSARADVPFTGLLVVPANLEPAPANLDEAKEIAAEFVDLATYEEPIRQGHAILFGPRIE